MKPSSKCVATLLFAAACSGGRASGPSSTPPPPPVATVVVAPGSGTLFPQQTLPLTATLRDAAGNVLSGRSVTWNSSAPAVASVNASGLVTAAAPGSALIQATSEGKTGTSVINVIAPVASVVITGSLRDKVGDSYTYTATARLADGTIVVRPLVWSIQETARGVMTSDGILTPSQTGTITLLATIDGVVWQGTTTAYDWTVLNGAGSSFLTLLADNQITNKFGTSEYAQLVIGCSTGTFLVWISTDNFVTANGLVAYSFDGGTAFTANWLEFNSFHSLGYPGLTNLAHKTFALQLASSRSFGFAFTEFQGSAKAMIFRVTGLGPILSPLLTLCPGNNIVGGPTALSAMLQGLPSHSHSAESEADAARRAVQGPMLSTGAPPLGLLQVQESQKGVRRPR